jgi:hypothetical protein
MRDMFYKVLTLGVGERVCKSFGRRSGNMGMLA